MKMPGTAKVRETIDRATAAVNDDIRVFTSAVSFLALALTALTVVLIIITVKAA